MIQPKRNAANDVDSILYTVSNQIWPEFVYSAMIEPEFQLWLWKADLAINQENWKTNPTKVFKLDLQFVRVIRCFCTCSKMHEEWNPTV